MKHPPPWLFVLTGTTYGVVGQFTGLVMPYATEHSGADLGSIGWYNALLFVPTFLLFLYAPIVDIGPRRKYWLVIVSAIGAACLVASFQMKLPDQITAYLAFGFAAQLISGLVGSCSGGLMAASLPDELRGRASGWYNIGNLSGGGAFAAIAIAMIGHDVDPRLIGVVVAVMMMGPSLGALWIDEPPRPHVPPREVFRQTLREVGGVLSSRSGITGIALSLSPVGTAALANFNDSRGVEGVVASDAALNLIGATVLAVVFWRLGSFGKWRHRAEPGPGAVER